LHERGLGRHKGEYWPITDDRACLSDAFGFHRLTDRFDEQYGTEDRDEWVLPQTADELRISTVALSSE